MNNVRRIHRVTLCVLCVDSEEDFTRPWKHLFASREQYYLRYESEYLLELGKAMEYMASIAISLATQEALKYTLLSGQHPLLSRL